MTAAAATPAGPFNFARDVFDPWAARQPEALALWWVDPSGREERFTYRQIMYYVCFKAMLAAVKGARHGWRKLDRTGSVDAGQLATA